MRNLTRSTVLCSALAILAACDNSETPLAPQPQAGAAAMALSSVGPYAFYSFDQALANNNAVHTATGGYQGGAYTFNGEDQYIDLPVNLDPDSMPEVTMGAWARVASIPTGPAQVLSHDDMPFDRSLGLDQRGLNEQSIVDGKHRFAAFTGSGVLPGAVVDLSRWVFLAAVYNGETVTLYVDGAHYTTTGTPGTGTSLLRVGGNPKGSLSGEYFHGVIDNVFVYNRALSAQEIATIRTGGACAIVTMCVGTPGDGVVREGLQRIAFLTSGAGTAGEMKPARVREVSKMMSTAIVYLDQAGTLTDPTRKAIALGRVRTKLNEALALLGGTGAATAAARDEALRVRTLVQASLDAI